MNKASVRKFSLLLIAVVVALLAVREEGTPSTDKLIDLEGTAVLIVEETDQRAALPTPQQNILLGEAWTSLLPDGNWRVWDKDIEFTGNSPFKEAFERPRESLPWLIVSGKKNYEGPLPTTVEAMTRLVEAAN